MIFLLHADSVSPKMNTDTPVFPNCPFWGIETCLWTCLKPGTYYYYYYYHSTNYYLQVDYLYNRYYLDTSSRCKNKQEKENEMKRTRTRTRGRTQWVTTGGSRHRCVSSLSVCFFFFFFILYLNYFVIDYAYRILHNDNDNNAQEHRKGPKRRLWQHV